MPGGITGGFGSNLTLNGGVVGLGNGDFTRGLGASSNQVRFTSSGGFAAYTADRSVNFGGLELPATATWGFGSFVPDGQPLILGAADATHMVTVLNPLDLGTAGRTIRVDNGSASTDAVLSGDITATTSAGGLTKTGAGTLVLSGANTYTGTTTVSAGTLLANNTTGSGTGGNSVIVGAAGTLGGTGTITGVVTVDGKLSPGNSIESLATGTVNLNTGSTLVFESSFSDANFADLLDIAGSLNISGTVTLDLLGADLANLSWVVGDKLSIASYTGTWNSGTFDGWADDSTQAFGGNLWMINYDDLVAGKNFTSEQAGAAGYVTLTAAVPEPTSAMLLLVGALGMLNRRRRQA
ncbi:MAG: PEP-CTERM sorting domain-containing protein [Verrucomicrobia bacterium]|nr:MAG: PEP-CTERM sorting domain-containing protein [Verrucomicrobiota bacterium]